MSCLKVCKDTPYAQVLYLWKLGKRLCIKAADKTVHTYRPICSFFALYKGYDIIGIVMSRLNKVVFNGDIDGLKMAPKMATKT